MRFLRWLGWTALSVLAVVVVGVAAVVLWRVPLAQWALPRVLEAQGLQGSGTVVAMGTDRLILTDVTVAQASARRLAIDYDLRDLIGGRIEAIAITGLALPIDLSGEGPPLGDLQALLAQGPAEGETTAPLDLAALPTVVIEDAHFPLATPQGPARLQAEGRFTPRGAQPGFSADLDGSWQDVKIAGKVEGALAEGRLADVDGTFELTDARQRGRLTGRVTTDLSAAEPALSADLSGRVEASLAALLAPAGFPAPTAGAADLRLTLAAPLPTAGQQDRVLADPMTVLGLPWSAEGEVVVEDLALARLADRLSGSIAFTTELAGDRRRLSLRRLAVLHASGLDPGLGLPPALDGDLSLVVLRLALTVDPAAPTVPQIDLAAVAHGKGAGRIVVTVQGSAAAEGGVTLPQATLVVVDLPLPDRTERADLAYQGSLTWNDGSLSLAADRPVELAVRDLSVGPVRSEALAAEFADFSLQAEQEAEGWAVAPGGTLTLERSALRLERQGAAPLPFTLGPTRLTLQEVRLSGDRLTGRVEVESAASSQGLPVDLADLSLSAEFERLDRVTLRLKGARVTPSVAGLPPFAVSGLVALDGAEVGISGDAQALDGQVAVTLQGSHDLGSGSGELRATLRPVTFSPGGLQPAQLLPALAPLQQALGTLASTATFSWNDRGVSSGGTLGLSGTSFVAGGVTVNGLALDLTLRSLWPVDSPPGQTLTAESIDAGVPLTEVATRLELQPRADGAPNLLLEQGAATFAGGRLRLEQGLINPIDGRYRLTLGADSLDLEALTDLLALPSLTAEGRLSGTLPIAIDGDSVVIDGARLAADGPGKLHFDSPGARTALAQGGETVELMLDALTDFRYDELSMIVNKPATGESQVELHLEGNNPEVLDGRQFNLNLNLTGNLAPILGALAEGQKLSDDVLSQLWRLGR